MVFLSELFSPPTVIFSDKLKYIPPSLPAAALPEIVLPVIVKEPILHIPPPKFHFLKTP